MKKKLLLIAVLAFVFTGIVASTITPFLYMRIIQDISRIVRDNYVRPVSIDSLYLNAIKGMLKDLDPHSVYLTPQEYKELQVKTEGEFGGLGIQIAKMGNYITIIAPIEGTPAYRAGILPGDVIIKIDGVDTKDMSINEGVKRMRGKPGTKCVLTIQREGEEPFDVPIIRDVIRINAVPYYGNIDGVGYIRLSDFSGNAYAETKEAIQDLLSQGVNGIVLDLRSNPGGLLVQAVEIASLFIDKGKIVVSTKGRRSSQTMTSHGNRFEKFPLVVLVDGGSASASEIVSGAIQDWDRGLIVGTKTFGKGSVQKIWPLSDGALKLTTALWYTPSGRGIDKSFSAKDTAKTFYTLRMKRVVHGGGGITPDTIIPYPELEKIVLKMRNKNLFFKFSVHYMKQHKNDFKDVNNEILNEFKTYVKKNKVEFTDEEWKDAEKMVKYYLRIQLFENKWGIKGKYRALLENDEQFGFARKLLKRCKDYRDVFKF